MIIILVRVCHGSFVISVVIRSHLRCLTLISFLLIKLLIFKFIIKNSVNFLRIFLCGIHCRNITFIKLLIRNLSTLFTKHSLSIEISVVILLGNFFSSIFLLLSKFISVLLSYSLLFHHLFSSESFHIFLSFHHKHFLFFSLKFVIFCYL